MIASLLGTVLLLVGGGLLVWSPFALYRRYRRLYGSGDSFALRWVEPGPGGAFRGGDHEMAGRFEVSSQLEWTTKLGFFLGVAGFVWTPLVLMGVFSGLHPMVTVGLPGLVVSWSIFLASRAVMVRGPAAVGLLRAVAVGEALMNLWVLTIVALATLHEARSVTPDLVEQTLRLLQLGSPKSLDEYLIPYSMRRAGFVAVGYALLSLGHAAMAWQACGQLGQARERQRLVEA